MWTLFSQAQGGNVPIQSFGYGRLHYLDSLWLMSNHMSEMYVLSRAGTTCATVSQAVSLE